MLRKSLVTLAVTGLLLGVATAQPIPLKKPAKWEFSGFAGWGSLAGSDSFATSVSGGSSYIVSLASGSGGLFGVRVSENRGSFFGAELEYTVADVPLELRNLSPQLPNLEIDQKVHNISYNGVVYLKNPRSRWRPFGTAGAGVSLYSVSGDTEQRGIAAGLDLRDRWKFAFSYGGGLKYVGGEQWGVRFDFRDRVTSVPDFGIPREASLVNGDQTPAFRPDGLFHHVEVSVGFVYKFNIR